MFKAGDVVQLKSGGPLMTILEVASRDGRDMVHCIWAAGTDEKSSWYPQEVLKWPTTDLWQDTLAVHAVAVSR
jgi:uncharacterized protein YodC (DUF2158 family)